MEGKRNVSLIATLLLVGLQLSIAKNETVEEDNITTTISSVPISTKVQERISIYETSIRYWDTNSQEVRQSILKDLARPGDDSSGFCPRIRFPLICDSDGMILENSCYFRLRRREKAAILPIMIFTNTLIEQARALCETEIKKKPTRS